MLKNEAVQVSSRWSAFSWDGFSLGRTFGLITSSGWSFWASCGSGVGKPSDQVLALVWFRVKDGSGQSHIGLDSVPTSRRSRQFVGDNAMALRKCRDRGFRPNIYHCNSAPCYLYMSTRRQLESFGSIWRAKRQSG